MNQRIEITISPKGEARVETKGFAGQACRKASEFLEKALGQRTSEVFTADFHQHVHAASVRQQERHP